MSLKYLNLLLCSPGRTLIALFLLVTTVVPLQVAAGTTKCPELSIVLDGNSVMPMGVTYSSHLEMHKIGSGPGYDGQWQVDLFTQGNVYPWEVKPPVHTNDKVDFTNGNWMQCTTDMGGFRMSSRCSGGRLIFDVSGGRIGSHKTGKWIGKIQGNQVSLRFDDSNPYSPVMTGTVNKVASGNISLQILPLQEKYVYSAANPGEFEIELKAQVTPNSYKGDIKWELPDIQGSNRTVTPASAQGDNIKVKFSGLPSLNAALGKKSIKARVKVGACEADDSKEIKVFFPRNEKNNPGGSEPNWFYYWSQTSARKGPAKYKGSAGQCSSSTNRTEGVLGYYRYKYLENVYYICDLSRLGANFGFMGAQWNGNVMTFKAMTGIDTFAVASHHENGHYSHFKNWWFQHKATAPFSPGEDLNKNSIKDTAEAALDGDKDLIPDSKEVTYHLDNTTKYTYPGPNDDEEIAAWHDEAAWVIGSANKEDWAKPGKQWP